MINILLVISIILLIINLLPFINNQHWIFRASDFVRPQLLFFELLLFISILIFFDTQDGIYWLLWLLGLCIIYNAYIFIRFTKFWRNNHHNKSTEHSATIKVISTNVYQFNKDRHLFVEMIRREKPDIFLTMESNQDWEDAFQELKEDYPNYEEVALENTYGIHFYTKLKINRIKVHYFVADDLPSIEAELETADGYRFVFFGVHPPPPSPTEESTSKERDGDLLSVAKVVSNYKVPVVITGDFNTVAWSRESILFKKASGLIDGRYGRGYLATFHTKYWFFRIPLDLLYHSTDIFLKDLKILPSIGSDHFPVYFSFYVDKHNDVQERDVQELNVEEQEEVEEIIEEGKEEVSDNRTEE